MRWYAKNRVVAWVCIVMVLVLGLLKIVLDYELSLFVFYFIPVSMIAWRFGLLSGLLLALMSAVVWMMSDSISGHVYKSTWFLFWNAGIRLLSFIMIAALTAKVSRLLRKQRRISAGLAQAMEQMKQLKGLIPICARCKKIRNDEGYWQQLEEFLCQHSDAKFTHGLCRDCADQTLQEAGLAPLDRPEQPFGSRRADTKDAEAASGGSGPGAVASAPGHV